jgi:hypothetical protein
MTHQNPDWLKDELILALDAWFQVKASGDRLSKNHPIVVNLSETLQELPFHPQSKRNSEFRSPDGVRRRIGYFAQFDRGKEADGRHLYREVWLEFWDAPSQLRIRADEIRTLE